MMAKFLTSATAGSAAVLLALCPAAAQTTHPMPKPASGSEIKSPDYKGGSKMKSDVEVRGGADVKGGTATGETGSVTGQGSLSGQGAVTTDTPSASPGTTSESDKALGRGHDPDKKTGLDRADEGAGQHGQQGRENAREQQGLDAPSASPGSTSGDQDQGKDLGRDKSSR